MGILDIGRVNLCVQRLRTASFIIQLISVRAKKIFLNDRESKCGGGGAVTENNFFTNIFLFCRSDKKKIYLLKTTY